MSKLINKTRLEQFATALWTKIKRRYDNAFVDAEIPETEKKIKFTKADNTIKDVSLEKYARLQDRNAFEKDVSVDNVGVVNNSHIGTTTSVTSMRRGLGFRQLTTSAFVDGHVDHIKIYLGDSATGNATFKVWAITKGANNRTQDRVNAVAFSGDLSIETVQENGQAKKIVNIPINKSYATETYFILRSTTHDMLVVDGIDQKYHNDAINLGDTNQPQDTAGSQINWSSNAEGANTAIMYLYGRESIGSLAEKLKQTQADGSLYVLKSETVNTGGRDNANRVVKLDSNGKLDATMLPAIATNEFITISSASFDENSLNGKEYQNGDIIFNSTTQKRYLCIDRDNTTFLNRFIELNSKDGSVVSVNARSGAITLDLVSDSADNKFKLKIAGDGGDEVVKEIEMISEDEITNMINTLPN